MMNLTQAGCSRRSFVRTAVWGGLGVAMGRGAIRVGAVEPFQRVGPPRLLLSLAAYSFRDYFAGGRAVRDGEVAAGRRMDMVRFIDFCAEHGCTGAELTSYYFPAETGRDDLLKLRRHAFLRGVEVSGTAVGNDFTLPPGAKRDGQLELVKKWVDQATVLGAPHIRVFAGGGKGVSKEEGKRLCIAALEECGEYAGERGVFLGVENHGGIVAEPGDLLEIVRAVGSKWVGINLDTGNFQTDDPYEDLARCVPYAVNVQVKVEMRRRGGPVERADLGRLVELLRAANYQGYVALEYEAAEDPWEAVPVYLGRLRELLGGKA